MNAQPSDFLAPALSKNRVHGVGGLWNVHNACVPSYIDTPEKLCDPTLWRLCDHLKPLDRIEVVNDSMTFFAMLIVIAVNPGAGVEMKPIHWWAIEGVRPQGKSPENKTGASVFFGGPVRKWCVKRGEKILREEFETEAQAGSWLAQHAAQADAK